MNILYVSPVKWQFLFQRHQALAYELSKIHDVFFLNPADKRFGRTFFQTKPITKGITLLEYPLLFSNRNNSFIHKISKNIEILNLKKHFENFCINFDLILIADLRRYYITEIFKNIPVHYDISDYPVQIIETPDMWNPIEQELLKKCHSISAASIKLVRRYENMGYNVNHIKNGYYSPVCLNDIKRDKDFIFSGALFRWIDTNIFDKINEAGYQIDIAGEVDKRIFNKLNPNNRSHLSHRPHLSHRYLGNLDHAEINKILPEYKTGLIPFKHGLLTDHSSPIKLYEYLKSGCNVISTAIPEVKSCNSSKVFILDQDLNNLDDLIKNANNTKNVNICGIQENRWEYIGMEYNKIIESVPI